MTFNPYAPPEEIPLQNAGPGDPGGGPVQPWSSDEVLSVGWETTKQHWPVLVFGPLIAYIMGAAPGQIVQFVLARVRPIELRPFEAPTTEFWVRQVQISLLVTFLGVFCQTFFQGGLIKLWLTSARGGAPQIGDVFSGASFYGRLLLTNLLLYVVILGGTALFIVPGIVFALGFGMAPYYVVDAGLSPMDAMKASWRAMTGQKLHMFGFGFWAFGVTLLGLLACCVGVLVSSAVIGVAYGAIFVRVSGRLQGSSPAVQPPLGPYGEGPIPPPGGGWGAA